MGVYFITHLIKILGMPGPDLPQVWACVRVLLIQMLLICFYIR